MSLRKKVVLVSPYGDNPLEYICTGDTGISIEVVPNVPVAAHCKNPPIFTTGPAAAVIHSSRDPRPGEIEALIAALERRVKGDLTLAERIVTGLAGDSPIWSGAEENLGKLKALVGDYRDGQSNVFAEIYGGKSPSGATCCKSPDKQPDHTGKLIFIQVPIDCDLDMDDIKGGEYFVLEQSEDSVYVVTTRSAYEAADGMYRLKFDGPWSILREYEDDDFMEGFVERLNMVAGTVGEDDDLLGDAAETLSRQIERVIQRKRREHADATAKLFSLDGIRTSRFPGSFGQKECCA